MYNLTQLRRNHRKKPNKKAGKKKPRPCDDDFEETIINAAPDSSIKNKIEISDIQTLPVSSTPRSALKRPRIANSVGKTSSKRLRCDPLINIDTKDDNEITETEDVPLIEATNEENNDINNEHSEDPAFNQEDVRPWVEFSGLKLTSKHMEMILNNQKLDCDIINYYQKLLSSSFPTMQGLQDTRLVPVRRDGSWIYALKLQAAKGISGQVHHNGKDHWVTSICRDPTTVLVYDSSLSKRESLSESLQIQLCQMYWPNTKASHLKITLPRVQQQTNCVDCGVFALAFLTEFCHLKKEVPTNTTFDTLKMREHLYQCIESGHLTPFPKRRPINPPRRLSLNKEMKISIMKNCAG